MEVGSRTSPPSREAIASVAKHYNAIVDTFPDAETHFERKWVAWHAVCRAQAAAGTSVDKCVETDEFEVVKRLGPKIIQFVVFKLAKDNDEQNFYGVFLCKALRSWSPSS